MIILGEDSSEVFAQSLYNYLPYFDALVVSLLWTFGFIIMVNQKLNSDIHESKTHFEQIFHTSPDAAIITRLSDGLIIDWNEGYTNVSGYTSEDMKGKTSLEINLWKNPEDRQAVVDKLLKTGVCRDYEAVFTIKGGKEIIGVMSAKIISLLGVPHIISITRDITEKFRTNELIKSSEIKYRSLFENMTEGVALHELIFDDSGKPIDYRIIDVNKSFYNLTEISASDAVGRLGSEIYKMSPPPYLNEYTDVVKKGEPYSFETFFAPLNKHFNISVITHSKGQFATVFLDLTEQKNAIQQIIIAKEKAEEINRLKSSFLANMSHELRTPLNGILGFSELLKNSDEIGEVRKMAEIINRGGNRLLQTLNKILDLASIEANTLEIIYESFDLVKLIRDSIDLYKDEAFKKNLELKYIGEYDSIMLYSSPAIILDCLKNLIQNAVTYTNHGSVSITLKHVRKNDVAAYEISVIDTGIGIEENNLEIIFDEFRQASEGWGRSYEGTGLGLSICRKYMNLLEGKIEVKSTSGQGSEFLLTIPIKKNNKDFSIVKSKLDTAEISGETKFNQNSKRKILYIEDEIDSINLVKLILKNYIIDEAQTAKAGIELAENNSYDLILLDINLGIGDSGLYALEKIKEIPSYKNVPIVALTAFAFESDKEEFLQRGCSNYMSKPFSGKMLLSLVQNIIK